MGSLTAKKIGKKMSAYLLENEKKSVYEKMDYITHSKVLDPSGQMIAISNMCMEKGFGHVRSMFPKNLSKQKKQDFEFQSAFECAQNLVADYNK